MNKPKNIVLLTIDALRYDHSKIIIDRIQKILGKGMIFNNAYSTGPSSSMSYIGYLSSKFPSYPDEKYFITKPRLKRNRKLLFEVLKDNGFKTHVIANGPFHNNFGYDQGIDTIITKGNSSSKNKVKTQLSKFKFLLLLNRLKKYLYIKIGLLNKAELSMPYLDSKEITKIVKKFPIQDLNKNCFIQINYMDTHTPINMSNPYIKEHFNQNEVRNSKLGYKEILQIRRSIDELGEEFSKNIELNQLLDNYEKLYYYETIYAADNISELLEYFESIGQLKDTVFILHSDHGEYLKPEGKLLGHGHPVKSPEETLNVFYENLVHVPLAIWGFGTGEIDEVVSLVDLSPTVLDMLGIMKPSEWYGETLFSDLMRPVIIEDVRYGNRCYCVRIKDWAFAYNNETKHQYLFNTRPENKIDRSNDKKELVKHMHNIIDLHKKKINHSWSEYLRKDIKSILS